MSELVEIKCKECGELFQPTTLINTKFCSQKCGRNFWAKENKKTYHKNFLKAQSNITPIVYRSNQPLDIHIKLHDLKYTTLQRQTIRNGFATYKIDGVFKPHKVGSDFGGSRIMEVKAFSIRDVLLVMNTLQELYLKTTNLAYKGSLTKYVKMLADMETYLDDKRN